MKGGHLLGWVMPDVFRVLGGISVAKINPVTAVLVWLLVIPTMVQIDYSVLGSVWRVEAWRRGSLLTLTLNWLIKPSTMAVLAVLHSAPATGEVT